MTTTTLFSFIRVKASRINESVSTYLHRGTSPKFTVTANKRILIANCGYLLVYPNALLFIPMYLYFQQYLMAMSMTIWSAVMLYGRLLMGSKASLSKFVGITATIAQASFISWIVGPDSNMHFCMFIGMLAPFLVFSLEERSYLLSSIGISLLLFSAVHFCLLLGFFVPLSSEIFSSPGINLFLLVCFAMTFYVLVGSLYYNNEVAEISLNQKNKEITDLLDNLRQGIIVFDKKMRVLPGYSQHTEKLLGRENLTEMTANELFSLSNFDPDSASQFCSALFSLLGEDLIAFEANEHLLPEKFHFKNGNIVRAFWEPIINDQTVNKIMVVMKDITEHEKIALESDRKDKKLALIFKVFEIGPDFFHINISTFRQYINAVKDEANKIALANSCGETKNSMKSIFRAVHTIKGNSRIFPLIDLVTATHDFESWLEGYASKDIEAMKNSVADLMKIILHLDQLIQNYLDFYHEVFAKNKNTSEKDTSGLLREFVKSINKTTDPDTLIIKTNKLLEEYRQVTSLALGQIIALQVESGKNVAKDLGLPAPEISIVDNGVKFDEIYHPVLQDIMNHIIRNSVDHGLINREDTSPGKIEIETINAADNGVRILIRDNGPGLNLTKIKQKSYALGANPSSSADEDIARLIFMPALTTKEAVTEISGRGVGMDFVFVTLQSLGGRINVIFDSEKTSSGFRKFHFEIFLPQLCIVEAKDKG